MTPSPDTRLDSLAGIASAAELATIGQSALRQALRSGATELELLATVERAMEEANEGPVDAAIDLLSGERTALVDGVATERVLHPGDPVILDVAPFRAGYWADSCATVVCGTPDAGLRRCHEVVLRALEAGIAAARPGVTAEKVDACVREVLDAAGLDCPHHTGHGVGTEAQIAPFLLPGERTPLEDGMAIAIEPGAYGDGFGVRLEHLVVIEADGARPLTQHSLSLTLD